MKRQSGTSKDASQESKKADWFTGAGNPISFEEIINIVKTHSDRNGIVYVGSDSFVEKDDCIFSTAICLWKGDSQSGGRYFIKRNRLDNKQYITLMQRITSEVQKSIDVGLKILSYCPQVKIELHLDISESDKNTKKIYIDNFKRHLALNIASMMQGYSDQTYELTKSKYDQKNQVTLIDMEIFSDTGSVVVTWRVKESKDRFFVIDLIVADISLVVTKRSEFNSMLKKVDNDLSKFNEVLSDQNEISYQKITE